MLTSLKSIGNQPSLLSNVIVAEAIEARARSSDPEKIMSSVRLPRSKLKDCSPSTHRMASAMLDFPDPFGPIIAVIVGENSKWVLLANVL
jgi:hypothetical protein